MGSIMIRVTVVLASTVILMLSLVTRHASHLNYYGFSAAVKSGKQYMRALVLDVHNKTLIVILFSRVPTIIFRRLYIFRNGNAPILLEMPMRVILINVRICYSFPSKFNLTKSSVMIDGIG